MEDVAVRRGRCVAVALRQVRGKREVGGRYRPPAGSPYPRWCQAKRVAEVGVPSRRGIASTSSVRGPWSGDEEPVAEVK